MPTATPRRSSSPRRRASGTGSSRRRARASSATSEARRFERFCQKLTLPDGQRFRLEGHLRLIIREVFATGRVELLVLIPKGNYKTTLFAALAVFHVLTRHNAQCFIGAADKVQADEMYRFASHFVESEPELAALLTVRRSTREIRSNRDQGFINVLASDDSKSGGKRQGFNPTLALIDELHAHDNPNLYVAMRSGLFKNDGLLVTITTAGHARETVLGRKRREFLGVEAKGGTVERGLLVKADGSVVEHERGRLTIARTASGGSAMLEWACRSSDDLSDMRVVKLANPARGVTLGSLEDGHESLPPWDFARYRANVWTPGFRPWLPKGAWAALERPGVELDEGEPVCGMVDMGRYSDSAAVVIVSTGSPRVVKLHFYRRGSEDHPVDYELVKQAIREVEARYELLAMGFDPKYMDQAAEELEAEGIRMLRIPSSNERWCPASMQLRRDIIGVDEEGDRREPALVHDGDEVLAAHVEAGVTKDVGADAWRLVKPKTGELIDGLIALAGANQLALSETESPWERRFKLEEALL